MSRVVILHIKRDIWFNANTKGELRVPPSGQMWNNKDFKNGQIWVEAWGISKYTFIKNPNHN